MKIEIEQNCSGTGEYRWSLETGPEHIDVFSGTADTLGECFQEIIRMDTLNAQHYVGVMVEEPSKPMNEVMNRLENKYKDAEENAASYITDEVLDRLVKKYQAQKLWNMVRGELGYSIDCCDEIVDLVEKWLPKEQSASGSQNVDVEFLVDGFNDCLCKMKEMLR
jgi:hypothetical protein